jgi:hypothetical protein
MHTYARSGSTSSSFSFWRAGGMSVRADESLGLNTKYEIGYGAWKGFSVVIGRLKVNLSLGNTKVSRQLSG